MALGASDDTAALAERLQFTIGESPCPHAHNQDGAISAAEADMARRWPTFHEQLTARTPYRSITSFPVLPDLHGDGAVDLYFTDTNPQMSPTFLADAWAAVDAVGHHLTQQWRPAEPDTDLPAWLDSAPARMRMRVWTAIGMVNIALQLTTTQALDRLPGYAYSHDSTIEALADNLINGHVDIAAVIPDAWSASVSWHLGSTHAVDHPCQPYGCT